MWKCLCTNIIRSVSQSCDVCGRSYEDIRPYAIRLHTIQFALSIMSQPKHEIDSAEQEAFSLLTHNLSISEISEELAKTTRPSTLTLARVLRNLEE